MTNTPPIPPAKETDMDLTPDEALRLHVIENTIHSLPRETLFRDAEMIVAYVKGEIGRDGLPALPRPSLRAA